jgi:hypothetical protein
LIDGPRISALPFATARLNLHDCSPALQRFAAAHHPIDTSFAHVYFIPFAKPGES